MLRPYSLALVVSFTVVVLLLAACSGSSDESADTTLAQTTIEQATTTTTASTTTAATTTTVAAATTTTEALPEVEASGSGEPWDLVFISDSRGFNVARAWADLIEEAEGVEVRVHDHATGRLSLVQVREWLTADSSDSDDELRGEVADAEIIFVFGNPYGSGVTEGKGCAPWPEWHSEPPEPATPADWAPYGDVLRDIFDVVVELRAGQPTVIRTADEFAAPIANWREAGIEAICTASFEAHAGVIREAADEYGVGTASWYDAFNGPDHDEDPIEKGYIASDGWHQSGEGAKVEAEVLHALGYDQIIPTTAPMTTTDAVDPVSLRLTFNGESCTYDGETELTPGPVELVFLNESEGSAAVNMVSIDEGYTIQDVVDDLGPEPSTGHHPSWTRELGTWRSTAPGESHLWEGDLEMGLYAMVCARMSPLGVWFGTGLTVEG